MRVTHRVVDTEACSSHEEPKNDEVANSTHHGESLSDKKLRNGEDDQVEIKLPHTSYIVNQVDGFLGNIKGVFRIGTHPGKLTP